MRVSQTFAALAKSIEVPVEIRPALRERNFGVLEGVSVDEYAGAERSAGKNALAFRPEGGESYVDLELRLTPIVSELVALAKSPSVLAIVAHGNINRTLLGMLLKRSPTSFTQRPSCLNVLSVQADGSATALLLDSLAHLETKS